MTATTSIRPLLVALLGPALWAIHLFVLYGVEATACAVMGGAVPRAALVLVAILMTVGFLAILWAGLLRGRSPGVQPDAFLARLATGLAMLAIVGIVWNTYPALVLAPCRTW